MTDDLLIDTTDRLFTSICTFDSVERAEANGWAPELWAGAADMGLPWVGVSEPDGGSGGNLGDALAVLRVAGRHAMPIPLAENGILGGWLMAGSGIQLRSNPITVVPGTNSDVLLLSDGCVSGTARSVPWARSVGEIVALVRDQDRWSVVVVESGDTEIEQRTNLAGEPRDTVNFNNVVPVECQPAADGIEPRVLFYRGALSRVALMTGALERISELTVSYTSQREQFGRQLASFQAVQAHIVQTYQDAVLVDIALQAAATAAERRQAEFEIASAKFVANEAVRSATRSAHQAHGAMGTTREYPLHHFTRRLWSWRSEYGDGSAWAAELGTTTQQVGPDLLYPLITAGSSLDTPQAS